MRKILGAFEKVNFPELEIQGVVAKIDTGAYNGALHATHMVEIGAGDKKSRELVFRPFGYELHETRAKNYRRNRIRSSNGSMEERFIIDTVIEIEGQTYPIAISLTDRSQMKKQVLIGRKFLRQHNFLVDVRKRAK